MHAAELDVRQSAALTPSFHSLLEVLGRIESLCAARHLNVRIVSEKSLAIAKDLEPSAVGAIVHGLSLWIESFVSSNVSRLEVADLSALRTFCQATGSQIPDDFYSTVRQGDVVELYRIDAEAGTAFQVWRNWEFLSLCSYDLLSLITYPMDELFHREERIQVLLNGRIAELISDPRTKPCDVPEHVLTEKKHRYNRQFKISNRFYAPVFRNGTNEMIGFVSTLRASLLESAYASLPNVSPLEL